MNATLAHRVSRRRSRAVVFAGLLLWGAGAAPAAPRVAWPEAEAIVQRIRGADFPAVDFRVTDFGARCDVECDARPGIMRAIARCNAAGGGRVIVPAGAWRLDGPLVLKSNVNLHLEAGATLRFNPDPELYLPVVLTRWEGTELFNYSPFIYAYLASNVALTGAGTIDGGAGETYGPWRAQQRPAQAKLRELGAQGAPVSERVFGRGDWLRPPLVQFFGCTSILLDGLRIVDAPFWCVHFVSSRDVTVRRVTIDSPRVNNDGIDVDSSRDVLIEDCVFKTGDDCIALKSGRDEDGRRLGQATENVVVRRCEFHAPVAGAGFAIGSEMSGSVRHVFLEQCTMGYVKIALNFKGNLDRGGAVERVRLRDVIVERTDTLIAFTTDYPGYRGGNHPPRFQDFVLEDIACRAADTAFKAVGVPAAPIQEVQVRRLTVERVTKPSLLRYVRGFALDAVRVNGEAVVLPSSID